MRLVLRTVGAVVVAVLGWFAVFETRRLAQVVGEERIEIRRLETDLADARRLVARGEADSKRLGAELEQALGYAHALGEAMTAESESRERQATARAAANAMVSVPPPAGVERCLQTLQECLRADGFAGLVPMRATALVDRELRDVEWLDTRAGVGGAELIVSRRFTATLDRARGALALHFVDGIRRVQGVHGALPPEGFDIVLQPVVGAMWEERLPYLLTIVGEYPPAAAAMAVASPMDSLTRAHWLDCFDRLFRDAGADFDLRVAGFAGLDGARFRTARIFGYDRGRLLAFAADCDALSIEIDERAGIVSLLLQNGTLRRDGTESTIGADGYRMLLPNVTPGQAVDAMLGMVVRR